MNYKDFIIWIKNYSCKNFFSNKFYKFGDKKGFANNIQPLLKFLINEIDFNITQSEKRHSKSNIHTNIS